MTLNVIAQNPTSWRAPRVTTTASRTVHTKAAAGGTIMTLRRVIVVNDARAAVPHWPADGGGARAPARRQQDQWRRPLEASAGQLTLV